MSGQLYIGYDRSTLFKIGITSDHKKRYKAFKTGNPTFGYLFIFRVDNPAVAEIELHTKFSEKRIEGEWFQLGAEDLKWIWDRYASQPDRHPLEEMEQIIGTISTADTGTLLGIQDFIRENGYSAIEWEER